MHCMGAAVELITLMVWHHTTSSDDGTCTDLVWFRSLLAALAGCAFQSAMVQAASQAVGVCVCVGGGGECLAMHTVTVGIESPPGVLTTSTVGMSVSGSKIKTRCLVLCCLK